MYVYAPKDAVYTSTDGFLHKCTLRVTFFSPAERQKKENKITPSSHSLNHRRSMIPGILRFIRCEKGVLKRKKDCFPCADSIRPVRSREREVNWRGKILQAFRISPPKRKLDNDGAALDFQTLMLVNYLFDIVFPSIKDQIS